MAYMIQYEGNAERKFATNTEKRYIIKRLCVPIFATIFAILLLISSVRTAILDFILPGNSDVTIHAAEEMIEDLQRGQPFKEAFANFCIEIIENA